SVRQRRVLRTHGDMASDRLWSTGDRGIELTVRQLNLVGFHLDGAAVPKCRLRRDGALLTGEVSSAVDKNGTTISVRDVQDTVCVEDSAVGEAHGLRPREADRAAMAGPT